MGQRPAEAGPTGSSLSTGGASAGTKPVGPGSFRNVLPAAEDWSFPVQTDLYSTEVRARGGRLTTWRLARFTDASDAPADLVNDSSSGLFDLAIETRRGEVDLSKTVFQAATADAPEGKSVQLVAQDSSGAKVALEYRFAPGRYSTQVNVQVVGFAPDQEESFLRLRFPGGISFVERDPKVDRNGSAGVALLGKRYLKHGYGRGGWSERESGVVHWVGTRSKYFLLAAIPGDSPDGEVSLSRKEGQNAIPAELRLPLSRTGPSEFSFTVYAGPMQVHLLEEYGVDLQKAVELGWSLIVPLTRLLLRFFNAVHRLVPNYGVVILILSVLTKLLFYPLTKKSMESMKQMQVLKPEMDRIAQKFKDDPQRRNQATLELYKKHKVNPVGGCLPILIQMPVFFALYSVLNTAIELRKAPFALWVRDLSAPDKVASIAGFPIHVLPLVMAATMFWQQKLTPTDPRQAAMAYMMPAIMTIFFYPMPSGLVFYWTVNNLMSIGQQIWMNRTMKHSQLAPVG